MVTMVLPLTDQSAFIQIMVLVSRIDCKLMSVMLRHSDAPPLTLVGAGALTLVCEWFP